MRYVLSRAAADWNIDEIVDGDRRPCSDAYLRARAEHHVQIFRELVLLRAAGCPPDLTRGNPEVESWKGKKRNARNPEDFQKLCRLSGKLLDGTVSTEPLYIPPR